MSGVDRSLPRLDRATVVLLLLWVGMALGFAFLVAPVMFQSVPSRAHAGLAVGRIFQRLDWAAWIAFGGALALSAVPRWLQEIGDGDNPVGPLRLWVAATLAALLMCMASSFIITPRIEARRTALGTTVDTLPADHPERAAFAKAHAISRQMLILRMLLALGLAGTVVFLPRKGVEA